MEILKGLMQEGGRVVVPAAVRKKLMMETGKEVLWIVDEDNVSIMSRKQGLNEARKYFKENKKFEGSIVEDLLADRKKEAARENEDV